jgi:hypothetical protein
VPASRPTPAQQVADAVSRLGAATVVDWATGLLTGAEAYDAPDRPPLTVLVGPGAEWLLSRPRERVGGQEYWARTWGARTLLYVWEPAAAPAVVSGLRDPHWRPREMSAKVARARELGEAGDALARLTGDDVRRVRLAAVRALAVVGEGEHAAALHEALDDPEPDVRRAAARALEDLASRLDRPV